MDDLKSFSVCAWQNASIHLGIQNWAQNNANYREYPEQKWQVADWLNQQCQVLLIDDTLLNWHLKQFNARWHNPAQSVDISSFNKVLLPSAKNPLWFYVGFTDKVMRDAFDQQLTLLKQSGQYDVIRNNF